MSHVPVPKDFEITLRPETSWFSPDLKSLWQYRDLLMLLVWRDFVAKYKQTVLGPLWFVIQPLLLTVVFTVIFGRIAGLSTDGLPPVLFYMCGQVGWSYFALTLGTNSSTFMTNAGLFSKVYFPRLVLPLSALISNLGAFVLQLTMFLAFLAYFRYTSPAATYGPGWQLALLPAVIAQTVALSLGVSLILSALTAKYRDLTHVTALLIQIWMYATPVIYPLSAFPERWRWAAALNPMTPVVESYRVMLLGIGTVETGHVVWSLSCAAVLVAAGLMLFGRVERTFVDIA